MSLQNTQPSTMEQSAIADHQQLTTDDSQQSGVRRIDGISDEPAASSQLFELSDEQLAILAEQQAITAANNQEYIKIIPALCRELDQITQRSKILTDENYIGIAADLFQNDLIPSLIASTDNLTNPQDQQAFLAVIDALYHINDKIAAATSISQEYLKLVEENQDSPLSRRADLNHTTAKYGADEIIQTLQDLSAYLNANIRELHFNPSQQFNFIDTLEQFIASKAIEIDVRSQIHTAEIEID